MKPAAARVPWEDRWAADWRAAGVIDAAGRNIAAHCERQADALLAKTLAAQYKRRRREERAFDFPRRRGAHW